MKNNLKPAKLRKSQQQKQKLSINVVLLLSSAFAIASALFCLQLSKSSKVVAKDNSATVINYSGTDITVNNRVLRTPESFSKENKITADTTAVNIVTGRSNTTTILSAE